MCSGDVSLKVQKRRRVFDITGVVDLNLRGVT